MSIHTALLIQDLTPLIDFVAPYVDRALEAYLYDGVEFETAWKWIIEEELELIYGLFGKDHNRSNYPYSKIHQHVNNATPAPLSKIIAHHIGAPVVAVDHNVVELTVFGRSLIIQYVPLNRNPIDSKHYINKLYNHGSITNNLNAVPGPASAGGNDTPHGRRHIQKAHPNWSLLALDT